MQPPGTKRVEITTPEVTRALRFARQLPGIRSATIFGQSIHALIEDHFNLDDLRNQVLVLPFPTRSLVASLRAAMTEIRSSIFN